MKMDDSYYISLFNKFIDRTATVNEVQTLLTWFKERDASFNGWLDSEWNAAPTEIPIELKKRMFAEIEKVTQKPKRNLLPFTHKIVWRQVAAIIAIPLMIFAATYIYNTVSNAPKNRLASSTVFTKKGDQVKILLPDSSVVWVNSNSKLTYDANYNINNRNLFLEGEACFEVEKNPAMPFVVQTDNFSVTALGTEFSVCSYNIENSSTAILMSGKVEVKTAETTITLLPNERIVYNKKEDTITKETCLDSKRYAEWRNGNLYLEGESLENVAIRLERYYDIKIYFESDEIKQKCFTGYLRNDNIEKTLNSLCLAAFIDYDLSGNVVSLKSR